MNEQGQLDSITRASAGRHSEQLIFNEMDARGIRREQVRQLYTELEPCSGDGFPNSLRGFEDRLGRDSDIPGRYSFTYPPDGGAPDVRAANRAERRRSVYRKKVECK